MRGRLFFSLAKLLPEVSDIRLHSALTLSLIAYQINELPKIHEKSDICPCQRNTGCQCSLRLPEAGHSSAILGRFDIFEAWWLEQILDEWTRNVLNLYPKIEDSILSEQREMAKHFPDAFADGHEPLAAALELPDPDDRHVLATAIHCGAQVIVTDNISDFPAKELDAYRIEAMTADGFLARFFGFHRDEAHPALRRMLSEYRKPRSSWSFLGTNSTAYGYFVYP